MLIFVSNPQHCDLNVWIADLARNGASFFGALAPVGRVVDVRWISH
jgi:hypothetical protein